MQVLIKADDESFYKQWKFVLEQAAYRMRVSGMTFKQAMLAHEYPHGISDKARDRTHAYRILDSENGIIWADDGFDGVTMKLYWRVEASDGVYFCDSCRALCPDGTIIYFP
ncbi:hypothetical protein OR1_03646 [Geobacter sp. OR-1]|uniref:hypothetical protein n=1 Tax=Geobacter sp. OR-1 TaxID=1266765 RepID=UPI00054304AF|nr:hypothetical protein [Geobacter sp. OR-1]GAM11333.1 hypothetical protein OR1_03646 [Geobacter sp. OR-1]